METISRKDRHLLISHTGFTGTWMVLDRQTNQGFIALQIVIPVLKIKNIRCFVSTFANFLKEKEKTL